MEHHKNVFELLKKDHEKVRKLFKAFDVASKKEPERKESITEEVFAELEIHAKLEEEIFYPAVEYDADEETKKLVGEAYEEHRLVKHLIDELKRLRVDDATFDPKFQVLRENVERHIEEEEGELFPKARRSLSDEIEEITDEVEERKEDLMVGQG